MNRQEVYKLLVMVKATWPMHFASFKTSDFESQGATWAFALSDYSYEECSAGLKLYMRNDVKGFPPSPGQIIDCIHKLKENPLKRQTAEEAWKSVFRLSAMQSTMRKRNSINCRMSASALSDHRKILGLWLHRM